VLNKKITDMKNLRNDYCIRMFADSGNDLRPYFNEVNFSNGYLYATNSHIVGKIKANLCVKKYEEINNFPNAEILFSQHKSTKKTTVSVDSLLNDMMVIECCFKPKMVNCSNCDGSGEDTCSYCDSQHDCKECSGEGKVEGEGLELTTEHDCEFFDRTYNLRYLDIVLKTAVYCNIKEIEVSNGGEFSGTLFKVGDFDIIVMPKAEI
jgi:hypothetical protein